MRAGLSWGRYPAVDQRIAMAYWRDDLPRLLREGGTVLARGMARSYGDSCLNEGGVVIDCSALDRFLEFDPHTGRLTCEAGVTLRDIIRFALPRGWFPVVVPGTQFVTVGGAIANDVHGKNHHVAGTFGRHVRELALLRSDGRVLRCRPGENEALFDATIGGLGLTGIVTQATVQLRALSSARMEVENIPFAALEDFFGLDAESTPTWEYTVAWVDCASPRHAGRGIYQRARHLETPDGSLAEPTSARGPTIPVDFPAFALSVPLVRAFNAAYWRLHARGIQHVRAERFLFPLDSLQHWNRIYGRRGFVQFQCVVPPGTISGLIETIRQSGEGSFLSVLKTFGEMASPGLLSFPRPGITFALDFPMKGASTLDLMRRLETLVCEAGGAIYPAKDACMSPQAFRCSFPRLAEFEPWIDPAFSSLFWRRVRGGGDG